MSRNIEFTDLKILLFQELIEINVIFFVLDKENEEYI